MKASLVKGRCRASAKAEGFLPACGCDERTGEARRNPFDPSGNLPLTREALVGASIARPQGSRTHT